MSQIVLDAEAFRALSSDTRLQILKALDARRLTVSELSRLLNLNKATVFEHLKQLSTADLVKKEDEGRKWVYYKLTWKGKNVLHPENVQFMLLLGTAVLSVSGFLAQLGKMLSWWGTSAVPGSSEIAVDPTADQVSEMGSEADSETHSAPQGMGAPDRESAPPATETAAADDDALAPEDSSGGDEGSTTGFFDDPNLWLLAVLGVLLVATLIFAYQYTRGRRRENADLLRRIEALGPPEPDSA